DLPFEKLVEELQPIRALGHSPLFQVMFLLYNAPLPDLKLGTATLSPVEIHSGTAKFDLVFSAMEYEGELRTTIEYSTDLFEAETIERMAGHFQNLLAAIVLHPDERVDALPLLSTGEREQLVQRWNETECDYPRPQCVHELFEAQVAATPAAIALEFAGQQLSYQELNERANQLAHQLQSM